MRTNINYQDLFTVRILNTKPIVDSAKGGDFNNKN